MSKEFYSHFHRRTFSKVEMQEALLLYQQYCNENKGCGLNANVDLDDIVANEDLCAQVVSYAEKKGFICSGAGNSSVRKTFSPRKIADRRKKSR